MKATALDSDPSELVRRLQAATRLHREAQAATRRFAKLLWAYRSAGIKPPKDGSIYTGYSKAVSQRRVTGQLLRALQTRYKRKHGGRAWRNKRRTLTREASL